MNKVNIDGVWRSVQAIYVNIDGVWKKASEVSANIGGVWKKTWASAVKLVQGQQTNADSGSFIQQNADNMEVRVMSLAVDGKEHWNSLETSDVVDSTGYDQILVDWEYSASYNMQQSRRIYWGSYYYVSGDWYQAATRATQTLNISNGGANKVQISAVIHTDNASANHYNDIKVYSITLKNSSTGATKLVWNISQQ